MALPRGISPAYLAAAIILALNALLLWQTFSGPLPF